MTTLKKSLTLCWLYPELMSTYGDRGNIMCLQKRCEWRGIQAKIVSEIKGADLIFGGGAQDRQQSLVISHLLKQKETIQKMFNDQIPGLFVCGSPQLLGHYYETADQKRLPGLGIFDMVTKTGSGKPRLIGNLVAKVNNSVLKPFDSFDTAQDKSAQGDFVVGFENHSGRTFLGSVKPFATVVKGFGNNGEDKTEGAVYQNVIATYSHGPFLPKNPHIADWLIQKALEVKYNQNIELTPMDDTLEWQAHRHILKLQKI